MLLDVSKKDKSKTDFQDKRTSEELMRELTHVQKELGWRLLGSILKW
jgi:hypothetical protein